MTSTLHGVQMWFSICDPLGCTFLLLMVEWIEMSLQKRIMEKKKKKYDTILVIDLTTSSFNGLLIIGFFFFEDSMKWRKRFDKKKNEQIAKL